MPSFGRRHYYQLLEFNEYANDNGNNSYHYGEGNVTSQHCINQTKHKIVKRTGLQSENNIDLYPSFDNVLESK